MHRDRHTRIRGVRREVPDLRKLSHAVIALAQAQLEKQAEVEHQQAKAAQPPRPCLPAGRPSPRQRSPEGQRR